jgi:type I restriction enzyme S subunit
MTNATRAEALYAPSMPGGLPVDWMWARLDRLCQGVFDCPHSTPILTDSGPYVVRTQDIITGIFRADRAAHVSEETYLERTRRVVPSRGDLLYSREGTYFGIAAEMPDNTRMCLGQRMVLIRPDARLVNFRYLRHWLNSPVMGSHVAGFRDGSVAERLNLPTIRGLPILVPPMRDQRAIAEVLGALDDKIGVNESCIRIAHELANVHFQRAMTQGSVTAAIGDLATIFDGPHATPEKTGSGPWFLSISSLQGGRLVLRESAHLGEQDFARWTRRVTPVAGDVLFSYETRLGEAALMPDGVRACLGRRMALLRPRVDVVGPRTLLQAYLGDSFQETIRQRAVHGATVDRIPLTELAAWPIAVPERADRLESLLGATDEMAAQRERENETLAALRETLLPKLMSGQIRVRDAARVLEEAL